MLHRDEVLQLMDSTIGIYIHIPFCVKKCPYCDFNSLATAHVPDKYIDAVLKELLTHVKKNPAITSKELETVYIGGGTPSLVSHNNLKRLIQVVKQTFLAQQRLEITVEINPGSVTEEWLYAIKDIGINRLNIGVQSFSNNTLKSLGRIHSAEDALRCYEYARRAGFDNVGIDFIFGVMNQSLKEWEKDLGLAISLRPEHISIYNLTIEPGTQFYKLQKNGKLTLPSEEGEILMYEDAIDKLISAGYNQYEISNFSINGFESRHNLRYWLLLDYIGLGAGAHSYISSSDRDVQRRGPDRSLQGQASNLGVRWWNVEGPDVYMHRIQDAGLAIAGEERLTRQEAIEEGIFLGLRKTRGIDDDWFSMRFNKTLKDLYLPVIERLRKQGLVCEQGNNIRLTRRGVLMSNEVFLQFV